MKKYTVLKVIFILLMFVSICGLIWWRNDKRIVTKEMESINKYLVLENDSYRIKEDIKSVNDETVAWIKVNGTKIDYPVVQAKDNDYYLNHDYEKKKNNAGWIFMDYRNKLDDQNIIIYGHHRKDKIMFGDVDKLFKKNFYKDNDGEIILVVGDKNMVFKIFSVYKASTSEDYALNNYDNFEEKVDELAKKSQIVFDNDLTDVEQIITLSTCHNNNKYRLVIHGFLKKGFN